MTKQSIVTAAAIAATLSSASAFADLSANAAASTNYIWRGVSQTANAAAVSGGIDWSDDSGMYAGTWIGDVDFTGTGGQKGYEMDLYAGFAGEAGDVGYDVGVISYQYPMEPEINFTEVYVNLSVANFGFGIASTIDNGQSGGASNTAGFVKGDMYVSASADFEPFSVYIGSYMFDNDSASNEMDYIHYGVSFSKDDFTFAMDKNNIAPSNALQGSSISDNVVFSVTWSKEWSL